MPMWAKHYGVLFNPNPFFPVNTLALMRGAAAAQIDGISSAIMRPSTGRWGSTAST